MHSQTSQFQFHLISTHRFSFPWWRTWQPLHASIAPPIRVSISQSQSIFLSNPKRGKNHHEWRRIPNEEWESFPTPLPRGSPSIQKCFSIMQNEEWTTPSWETRLKPHFFTCQRCHRSDLSQQRSVSGLMNGMTLSPTFHR